ncbi:MAG: SDR family oxidoreductase [Burkholderiales bacterium]
MVVRNLNECTALLTASSNSIGFEIAAQLAEAGVPRIMLNGRDAGRGEEACERIRARAPGVDVRFTSADPRNFTDARRLVQATIDAFGALDILCTGVSGPTPRPFHELNEEETDLLIRSHFSATIYMCQAALPHLRAREGGVILNISSDAGKIATPGEAIIGGGKAGVIMFSRTLALEVSRYGIRVHAITPSIVKDTMAYDRLMANEFAAKLFKKAESKARLGVVSPKDIAPLAVFLASPAAAKMTGQAISVNGGISAA